jgi:hypothetical protein
LSAIDALKKFLGDRPHNYEPSLLVFPQLDEGKLREEFRLEDLGRDSRSG